MKITDRKVVKKLKFENVKHITKTTNIEVVNKLLATGWILLQIYEADKNTLIFVLGLT